MAAALEIGFGDLSMHAVARRLGVTTAALYRHVDSIDQLVARCVDAFTDRIEPPPPGLGWRQHMEALASSFRAAYRSRPGAASRAFQVGPSSPAAMRLVENTLEVLVAAGFDHRLAWRTASAVIDLATTWAIKAEAAASRSPGSTVFDPVTAEDFPTTTAVMAAVLPPDLDRAFAENLALLLDGVEQRRTRTDSGAVR